MRKKISNKKLFLILIIPVFIVLDILSCTILYFIEPIDYTEPDFSQTSYSFELYKKYSYDNNPDFYIKQISADDIVSFESDKRLKYIDDTIMIICKDGTVTSEVTSLIAPYNGKICGYISILNLYQVEFPRSTADVVAKDMGIEPKEINPLASNPLQFIKDVTNAITGN